MQGKYRALAVVALCSLAAAGAAFGATKNVFVGTPGPDTIYGTSGSDVIRSSPRLVWWTRSVGEEDTRRPVSPRC